MKIEMNPNTEDILQAVIDNERYCCCKLEKIDINKCPCVEFLESKELGDCTCGLYRKTEV